ncbi:MAG: hypothetical protein JXR70_06435 [Spirochaetales bacterium]|nr:hypothetical protein [Spirochaetales bacterium]
MSLIQNGINNATSPHADEVIKILHKVYDLFKIGQFDEAILLLEEALKLDLEFNGVASALKCANFWQERHLKLEDIGQKFEQAEYLIQQWDIFCPFIVHIEEKSERCLFSLKQYVFGTALAAYLSIMDSTSMYDTDIFLKIGICYKALGDYERSIEYFSYANKQSPGIPTVLIELADCYSLINELRIAKAFFREAFFINPDAVNLNRIESGMIHKLVEKIENMSINEKDIKYWVPVYGAIYGVFNIKRELRPLEFGRLRQAIYSLEKEYSQNSERTSRTLPKLLNHYFWLIDHYTSSKEDKSKINEVLDKIKQLDPRIYQEYTN